MLMHWTLYFINNKIIIEKLPYTFNYLNNKFILWIYDILNIKQDLYLFTITTYSISNRTKIFEIDSFIKAINSFRV